SGTRNCSRSGTRSPGAATVPSRRSTRPVALSRLAISGHQPRIWRTFSRLMMRGARPWRASVPATLGTTQLRERVARSRGWPPLAWLKCVQSGLAWNQPTGRPATSRRMSTAHTSASMCRVNGWLAACMPSASASWFTATSGSRPSAWRSASLAPPPPAKKSTTISPGRRALASALRGKLKACWVPSAMGERLVVGQLADVAHHGLDAFEADLRGFQRGGVVEFGFDFDGGADGLHVHADPAVPAPIHPGHPGFAEAAQMQQDLLEVTHGAPPAIRSVRWRAPRAHPRESTHSEPRWLGGLAVRFPSPCAPRRPPCRRARRDRAGYRLGYRRRPRCTVARSTPWFSRAAGICSRCRCRRRCGRRAWRRRWV